MSEIEQVINEIKDDLAALAQFFMELCTAVTNSIFVRMSTTTPENGSTDYEIAFGLGMYKGKYRK